MATNDFLPFCPTDTGTNLESQASYIIDTNRTNGNQPGVASSKLNNKALRQGTYIVSQLAQMIANVTNTDVVDNAAPTQLLAQFFSTFGFKSPVVNVYTSGSGTHYHTYKFQVASANATAGATYTNNGFTFTVVSTITGELELVARGTGNPTSSGTLLLATGSGDATISFYAVRAPLYYKVKMIGGGGGGGGGGMTGSGNGSTGGTTTFGSSFLTSSGGQGGFYNSSSFATGGSNTIAVTAGLTAIVNSQGGYGTNGPSNDGISIFSAGGIGAASPFGGAGGGGVNSTNATNAVPNSGSGAGGGGTTGGGAATWFPGQSGAAGAYLEALVSGAALATSFAYAIGTGGNKGTSAGFGSDGGVGGSGIIIVEMHYQ